MDPHSYFSDSWDTAILGTQTIGKLRIESVKPFALAMPFRHVTDVTSKSVFVTLWELCGLSSRHSAVSNQNTTQTVGLHPNSW